MFTFPLPVCVTDSSYSTFDISWFWKLQMISWSWSLLRLILSTSSWARLPMSSTSDPGREQEEEEEEAVWGAPSLGFLRLRLGSRWGMLEMSSMMPESTL